MEGKLIFVVVGVMVLSATISIVDGQDYYSNTMPHSPLKEKVTNLHFFFHDTLSGKNPTSVLVAKANLTNQVQSLVSFGNVFVIDDPLTVGPEMTSKVIGNARGMYVQASQDILTLVASLDFAFTSGEFNGSSISVFSRNPVMENERELAVVGGRGKFRMARGFAQLKTYFINATTGDAIVEYRVTVIHY